mmetsp:Transcript_1347/g.5847  ORF Transcript_1347/g.5847 Transcript_1347/m.5847 type:complete len:250 (+) Transcript_1347:805-1554(+)
MVVEAVFSDGIQPGLCPPNIATLTLCTVPQVISKPSRAAAIRLRRSFDGCGILYRRKRRNLRAKPSEFSLSLPFRRVFRSSRAFLRQFCDDSLPVSPVVRELWLRVMVAPPPANRGHQLPLEPKRRPALSFESRIPTPPTPLRFWHPRGQGRRRRGNAIHGAFSFGRGPAGRVCPLESSDSLLLLVLELSSLPLSLLLFQQHPFGSFFRCFTSRACIVGGPPRARLTDGKGASWNRHWRRGSLDICGWW